MKIFIANYLFEPQKSKSKPATSNAGFFVQINLKPGIVIRNLLRSLICCNSGTCQNFDAHHNDTMPRLRNPVRAPVSHQLRLLATKSNNNSGFSERVMLKVRNTFWTTILQILLSILSGYPGLYHPVFLQTNRICCFCIFPVVT